MSIVPVFGDRLPGIDYVDRPGAYALIRREGRWLFVRTPNGLFLPGGGVDPGETNEQALARELREEIDHELIATRYLGTAEQYLWSNFYGKHHRKIGFFFAAETRAPRTPAVIADHVVEWVEDARARVSLTLEFQRVAFDLI